MITSRRISLWLASAAAGLVISFSAAAADLSASPQTAEQAQPMRTAMPVPKARPLAVRKRVAVRYRARVLAARPWVARPAYLPPPAPVARLAAVRWPLMLGIGY